MEQGLGMRLVAKPLVAHTAQRRDVHPAVGLLTGEVIVVPSSAAETWNVTSLVGKKSELVKEDERY